MYGFIFLKGRSFPQELLNFLQKDEDFTIGFLELYAIQPREFPDVGENPDITVTNVSVETWDDYLKLQYELDSVYGESYAEEKQDQHLRNYQSESIQQILAYYKGKAAGSVDVIIEKGTAEIDGLMVDEDFQKKGIGSCLQKYVMDQFNDKMVILVADGEDTPKEMYRKQNYRYLGKQYELLKISD
ncbi:GNAT family N-acetyltransferase [Cytobacillus sp. NCCP-133]|uniref:GNAT family N-acetyltransferase n=1 Tax=Cytobacillus sp. NCCP-133 TaxID=766848 RepID=UPI0022319BB1|nr:GNAT family N-acetyltransferase [Cytobacillus sp. NCCP-133]GLB59602.1 hypothetical protein NCCP133_17350 [Cytobacillus sp. NCCP-133]